MKLISAGEAVGLIQDGMTIGVGGFGAYAAPETILQAMADSFAAHGHPASLTVTCGVSPGDNTNRLVGLNRIASEGLLDTIIAGHFANPPLPVKVTFSDSGNVTAPVTHIRISGNSNRP